MTLVFDRTAAGITLSKDGVKTFDTSLLPAALVGAAKITTTQTVTFPDPHKDNAWYWYGRSAGDGLHVYEDVAGWITMVPQEWGPQSVDPSYTDDLPDVLLGTVPAGTDYLDVKATITRTTDPQPTGAFAAGVIGDTLPPVIRDGKPIRLLGGSCLLEETYPLSRGFAIVLDGTNVYLRRYQSVSEPDPFFSWAAGNSNSATGYTYQTTKGVLVYWLGVGIGFENTSYVWERGSSNQTTYAPLTDTTDYTSEYSVDLEITPGYFNVDATVNPPATKTAIRLASLWSSTVGTSFTFSDVPFGVADSTRNIAVLVGAIGTSVGTYAVTSVTIGGVTATKLKDVSNNGYTAAIWMAAVPTGTSGNVVVTTTSGNNTKGIGVSVHALYHLSSTTPVDTESRVGSGSVTLTTGADGFAFVAVGNNSLAAYRKALSGLAMLGYEFVGPNIEFEAGFGETDGSSVTPTLTSAYSDACLAAVSLA